MGAEVKDFAWAAVVLEQAEAAGDFLIGFDLAAKKLRSVPALERECAIGAARALESLGRFDEAKARYDELAKNPLHKDALVTLEAERRGRKLASDDYRKRLAAIQNQLRPNTP